jgi:hypothetical protein
VARTLFALPDLTGNFPQVVSRIFFYNDVVINLYCHFRSSTLDGKAQKKGDLLSNRGKNRRRKRLGIDRHGDWQSQFSPVIILVLFASLLYFWGLKV